MSQPPFGQYGQPGPGQYAPPQQPYRGQPYPPPGRYQPQPQQPMKPYTFRAGGGGRVTIQDDAIIMSPMLKDFTFKRIRWDLADIAAVSVQPLPRNRCEVAVTRRDGTMRRYRQVQAAAAEVQSAFAVRGYCNPGRLTEAAGGTDERAEALHRS